jgi:hypothetical protein
LKARSGKTGIGRALVLLVGAGLILAAVAQSAPAAVTKKVTVYSLATGVQFINHQDDRQRGINDNPFDNRTNRLSSSQMERGDGPFAGDVAVYTFDLYTRPNLQKKTGEGSYTCYFNFAKHALCRATYEFSPATGNLIASGPVDFGRSGFKLVVSGGTQKYLGALGQVAGIPAAKNSQRLDFTLLR